ncbi:hypothetical protein F5882DRAFT_313072, partial [Hyaloscypha sp. PMI_1271]
YIYLRILVYNYIISLNFTYILLRVREYFESRARRSSSYGLLYKDIIFIVFKNKEGIVELTIRTIRDIKGIIYTLYKRLKYTLYENIEPLYTNPIIPVLAITIMDKAF